MPPPRLIFTLVMTAAVPATGSAQRAAGAIDTAGIHTTLRAFYFNLAHGDWEAIATDVLSAKVVAHRPVPPAMAAAAAAAARSRGAACSSESSALVEAAILSREGVWVEAAVPRCNGAVAGADRFRLIRFEDRWRFVSIGLFQGQATASVNPRSRAPAAAAPEGPLRPPHEGGSTGRGSP